ncbi:MAG: hypothetical protein ACKV2Q_19575 [Planctomycetaceae bacterium]
MRNRRRKTLLTQRESLQKLLFAFVCLLLLSSSAALAAEPLVGKKFDDALEQKIGRAWGGGDGDSIREAFQQLTQSNHVSIVLDRRIDPTQPVTLALPLTPLRDVIGKLSETVNAGAVVVGNVVYVGPAESAKKLRTLIELRNEELSKLAAIAAKNAAKSPWRNPSVSLTQRRTFAWKDLDRPRDVLKQVAATLKIEIDGLDKLPHDLWAGSSLTQVTATEALSLLLVQFGATFEFVPDRAAIRLVPIPQRVLIERNYALPPNAAETAVAARLKFADAEFVVSGANLTVQATVEQHTDINDWLKPGGQKPVKPLPKNQPDKPLSERLFTLKLENAALGDVIKTFVANGVSIEYDSKQFADAEISLEKKINIDVKQVSAEKLFRDLFEPLGIQFTIDGDGVRLRPKAK